MKASICLFPILVLLTLGCANQALTPEEETNSTIRIGSFNIEQFGPTKTSRNNTLSVLAQIASTYDLLAIEEVGSNNSSATEQTCISVMNTFVSRINEITGTNTYEYIRGNQYALIYKASRFAISKSGLYNGSQSFTYQPLIAYINLKNSSFDFSIIVIHTSPSVANTEIPALKTAMSEISTEYSEPDVICLGDYNADGSYYTEGSGTDLAGFVSPTYITVIPNSADTTVAASSNTYDRIELSSSMATDYASVWGVLQPGEVYDVTKCEGTATTAGTEEALSDHYPIWAEFYIDKDTD
jgi:deoxyribonuclease-1-like protein